MAQKSLVPIPGELIRETMQSLDLSREDFSEQTGLKLKTISRLLKGTVKLTPKIADKIAPVLKMSPQYWCSREREYRSWLGKKLNPKTASPITKSILKTGIAQSRVRYEVLATSQLSEEDRKHVRNCLARVNSPDHLHIVLANPNHSPGFSVWKLSLTGVTNVGAPVQLVRYRGVDVCLFFKRQTVFVEPQSTDPIPAFYLKEPAEAWMKIDLLNSASKDALASMYGEIAKVQEEVTFLVEAVDVKDRVIGRLESENLRLQDQISELKKSSSKQKMSPDKHRRQGQFDVLKSLSASAFVQVVSLEPFNKLGREFSVQFERPLVHSPSDPRRDDIVGTKETVERGQVFSAESCALWDLTKGKKKLLAPAKVIVGSRKA